MSEPADLRVSDEERERAAAEIRDHFAAGRLTDEELSERLSAVYRARTMRELDGMRHDLPALPASPTAQRAELVARRGELQRRLIQQSGAGIAPFALCTVIWLASGASGFFWPVFLLIGVLAPLLRNGWSLYGPAPDLEKVERDLERQRAHGENRHERRAGGRGGRRGSRGR